MDFIKNNLNELAKNNYKYIEIILGRTKSENIFDSRIDKITFDRLHKKSQNKTKNVKKITNKIYYINNFRLNINETFQQRCFQLTLIDRTVHSGDSNHEFLINFGERKMISIENFPTKHKYDNEVYRKIVSYNIKNKFYLNFIDDEINKEHYYNISLFMTKKNGKTKEILELIETYLNFLASKDFDF